MCVNRLFERGYPLLCDRHYKLFYTQLDPLFYNLILFLILFFRHPNKARKITQILAVVAVSVGAFIHGTTVSFPAVSIPSICKSNATNNNTTINNNNINNNGSFTNNDAKTSSDIDDILGGMPFFVTDDDISLIGKKITLHK